MTSRKRYIPYVEDVATANIRISHKHEVALRELAAGYRRDVKPIQTKKDLVMIILYAWIGKTFREIRQNNGR